MTRNNDERERLTKDSLRIKLEQSLKQNAFSNILAEICILLYIAIPYLCIRGLLKALRSAPWVLIGAAVLFGAAILFAVGLSARSLLLLRKQKKALKNGDFSVRENRLVSVSQRHLS